MHSVCIYHALNATATTTLLKMVHGERMTGEGDHDSRFMMYKHLSSRQGADATGKELAHELG